MRMCRQSAFLTLTLMSVPVVTSLAGGCLDLQARRQAFFRRPLFLWWTTQFAKITTRVSRAYSRWRHTCAVQGPWVRVKVHVKGTAEDRWPVKETAVGIWWVWQAGPMEDVCIMGIQECFLIPCILGIGWRKLWETIQGQFSKTEWIW